MRNNSLIETKFRIPQLPSRLVYRGQLIDCMTSGKDRRLISISGLAGSGKTCLALQWIHAAEIDAFWYSLDETDNDFDLFFRYFLSTIGRICEHSKLVIQPILENQKPTTKSTIIPILEECGKTLSDDIYFVLDDYHNIFDESVHDAISTFIKYIPQKMHLVVISRHALPFSIANLRLKNQIYEISADDLKFSSQEAQAYFKDVSPVDLSADQVVELNEYFEGWAGGLQLFGMSFDREKARDNFNDIRTRASQDAMAFLVDQVIDSQSEEFKQLIQYTAILDRFNADLCRVVTGMDDSSRKLRLLCRNNMFVTPLDTEQTWFRYHKVLSDSLKSRLKQDAFETYQDIHRKASLWFAENDSLEDAFRHAFASEDITFIGDVLEDHLMELYDRYDVATFRRWLAKFPYKAFQKRSLLRLYECRYNIESLRLLEAKSTLDYFEHHKEAFNRYEGRKKHLCQDLLIVLKCQYEFWMDSLSMDIDLHKKRIRRIHPENKQLIDFIRVDIAASYLLKGKAVEAGTALKKVSAAVLSNESSRLKIIWFRLMILSERLMGRLERVNALLNEAYNHIDQIGLIDAPIISMLSFEKAWICYYRNELAEGREYAGIAITYLDEVAGYVREQVEGNYLAALICIAANDTDCAGHHIQKIKKTAEASDNPYVTSVADALRARLLTAVGELEWPLAWAENRRLSPDEPFSFRYIHECLAYAELYNAQKEHRKALHILDTLRKRCEQKQLADILLHLDLQRCIALSGISKHRAATSVFDNAFAFAANEGYVVLFVTHANELLPFLHRQSRQLQSNTFQYQFYTKIINACGIRHDATTLRSAPKFKKTYKLTNRETEILKLLAEGLKYKEIATKSYVSIDTVRTHIKNIYTKLGVNSSIAAIKQAKSFGIISTP